jgi:hypothetical protein
MAQLKLVCHLGARGVPHGPKVDGRNLSIILRIVSVPVNSPFVIFSVKTMFLPVHTLKVFIH